MLNAMYCYQKYIGDLKGEKNVIHSAGKRKNAEKPFYGSR